MRLRLREFEALVEEALQGLPPRIQEMLQNVTVSVQLFPTREQMQRNGIRSKWELLGLYEGVPLTRRDVTYTMVLPDRIFIFKAPLESLCQDQEELTKEIRKTVVHELAHHFGIGDEELERMGY